jgi:hypothetical protein
MKFWFLTGLGLVCMLAGIATTALGYQSWKEHEYIASGVYWTMTCFLGGFSAIFYSVAILDRDPEE